MGREVGDDGTITTRSKVGWALGDGHEHGDDPAWDAAEAVTLYERLENEVIPEFYARDEKGIPAAWVARMRESMARLTPRFSANRSVREYTERHYLPAAASYQARAEDRGAAGKRLAAWRRLLDQKWPGLRSPTAAQAPQVSQQNSQGGGSQMENRRQVRRQAR